MRNDLIIDFETFGKDANKCAVIDCSVMVFNWDRFLDDPYNFKDVVKAKRFKLDVVNQVKKYGFEVDASTVSWWESLGPEVRKHIKPTPNDLTVEMFCSEFMDYLISQPNITYWWSRSNTFDPIILGRLFKSQNKLLHMEEYLKFWRVRDTRTYIDAKLDFPKINGFCPINNTEVWENNFKEHDSSWDILADVMRLQAIHRAENDMEMI